MRLNFPADGRVRLPEEALWLDEYIRELTGFSGSKFVDQLTRRRGQ